jgi:uncharacterized protein (TIGR03118 family)
MVDAKLVNPWGLSLGQLSAVWSSNEGSGTSTFYLGGASGAIKVPLDVVIEGGHPTGQVYNGTGDFKVGALPAMFIFSSLTGNITGWNPLTGAKAPKVASVRGAVYTGLAMVKTSKGARLLAADFAHRRIEAFDAKFKLVKQPAGAFRDSKLPAGYAPYNVAAIGDKVYVTYAQVNPADGTEVTGPGKGYVDVYTTTGTKVRRFVSRGALNAPWAVVKAPASFGTYAGNVLVGNFGDGRINAYDSSGHSRGPLKGKNGKAIAVDGLWGMVQGTALAGGTDALWFAAGIDNEKHGLMGLIRPAR